jgi:hypothetical protein
MVSEPWCHCPLSNFPGAPHFQTHQSPLFLHSPIPTLPDTYLLGFLQANISWDMSTAWSNAIQGMFENLKQ